MIALDSSALLAIVLGEPLADACAAAINAETDLIIAAPTLTEVLIAAAQKGRAADMDLLLDGLAPTVVPLTASLARAAAAGYVRFGKGFHDAKLNYGDSFSYALAREYACPLLFIGSDFPQTDVEAAL